MTINDFVTAKRAIRSGETNLGDLCADAYRYALKADVGLINGGDIRSSIPAGDITYADLLAMYPWGEVGSVVEATGQQLQDALEMASRLYPEECGGFLNVSGLQYTINSAVPSSVVTDEMGNFEKVDGPYRVTDVLVNGEPIILDKTYTVASHSYMLRYSGDGLCMFAENRFLQEGVAVDIDMLLSYINEQLGGTIGADYANPKGQGRITIK